MAASLQRAFAQVRAEGEASGEARGRMELLERLLLRRFKSVPKRIRTRITKAPAEQVDAWFDLAYDAPSLQAVFADA